jgi:D-alanine-D-alanine ligase
MRIAVLANLKKNAPKYKGMPADRWDDLDNPFTVEAIVEVLQKLGHETQFFEASILPPYNLIDKLRKFKPDLCFNMSESHFGDAREAQIPAVLEMLRIPYTGSKPLTLALALDKTMTKRVLQSHGLPTAEFQLFRQVDDPLDPQFLNEDGSLRSPLFVKPNAEGTSMGVSGDSIVRTIPELRERVAGHLSRYNQPILVERFIKGREVLVGMVGNIQTLTPDPSGRGGVSPSPFTGRGLTFMPILELDHAAYGPGHHGVYTNEMKTVSALEDYHYHCPAPLSAQQAAELRTLAAAAFHALDCKDVARVDFRLDESDDYRPYILEINTLPGLSPGYSDLCLQALAMGWEHDRLVGAILEAAIERHGLRERVLV